MIDPVTGWFKMEQIDYKTAAKVANIFVGICVLRGGCGDVLCSLLGATRLSV
jgi:hypothetical protein